VPESFYVAPFPYLLGGQSIESELNHMTGFVEVGIAVKSGMVSHSNPLLRIVPRAVCEAHAPHFEASNTSSGLKTSTSRGPFEYVDALC
jgi:hypothetical protein